jgi:hypothetical protein
LSPEKLIKYSLPFFAFAIVSRAVEEISFFYYTVPVMCLLFIVIMFNVLRPESQPEADQPMAEKGKSQKEIVQSGKPASGIRHQVSTFHLPFSISHLPSIIFVIPGIWFLLTSLWSSYPEVSATRALYFILLSAGCVSGAFLWIRYSGKGVLDFLLPANIFVVLLCLFSLVTNIPSDSWSGGHGKGFMGFFGHQNALASIILFTMPVIFSKLWKPVNSDQSSVNRNQKSTTHYSLLTAYWLLLTTNLLLLALTYSRASIVSLVLGVFVFLLLSKKWKVIIYSFSAAALLAIVIYLTPLLNQFADKIIKKDFPEFYSSRLWLWEPSFKAALNGGLTGLGYGISDPGIIFPEDATGSHYEGERFVREKGNSTLALIEETGVIGLILFLIPLFYVFRNTMRNVILSEPKDLKQKRFFSRKGGIRMTIHYSLITAAVAAFLLHSQFEAWWVGVGSVQLPLFFVYIGLIVQSSKCEVIK